MDSLLHGVEGDAFDVRGGEVHQVVLHILHRPKRVLLHPGAQPARGGIKQPLLAVAEQVGLLHRVAEVVLVVTTRRHRVHRL